MAPIPEGTGPGHPVRIEWRGRRASGWVPDPLARRDLSLSERTARLTGQAIGAAQAGSDRLPEGWEPLARLLLRAEGVASSLIEGVRAPLADIAAAEFDPHTDEPASWIADNLAAAVAGVSEARQGPLAVDSLHRWHAALMAHATHLPAELVGAFRDSQGWIGGTSPLDAAFVPPPPEALAALVDDLVGFANRTDLDPVTQAAAAHAQFEIIHPYGDGNGRVGRVLIGWILTRRLGLVSPPPVSLRMAVDRGGYLSGLTRFRMGDTDAWIRWFAEAVFTASQATLALLRAVDDLQVRWEARLAGVRIDAAARRVLALLPEHPVLAAATISGELGLSERTARSALASLAEHRIVEPYRSPWAGGNAGPGRAGHGRAGPGRPRHLWVAQELIDLMVSAG